MVLPTTIFLSPLQNNTLLALKMVGCVALVVLCWDVRPVFNAIWSPFSWLVAYTDPRKPSNDVLHEWYFRSSLDRFVWIYGMLCACECFNWCGDWAGLVGHTHVHAARSALC